MSINKTVIRISAETHKGVTRDHNEDNHTFCPDLNNNEWLFYEKRDNIQLDELGSLIVVADGMGGMNAGEVASELAIEGIKEYFSTNLSKGIALDEGVIRSFLKNAILSANKKITTRQKQDKKTQGMGTTIILAWIYANKVFVSWSGDSRCYRYNPASGLQALSKDHSYVQDLIDAGKLTEEQAFYHPDSNIVTQSLGSETHAPKPNFKSYELHKGDKIMLCSDGLNAMLQDIQIREIFKDNPEINTCTKTLIEESNKAGGHDNITIAIAEVMSIASTATTNNSTSSIKAYGKYALMIVMLFALTIIYFKLFRNNDKIEITTKIAKKDLDVIYKKDNIKVGEGTIRSGEELLILDNDTIFIQGNDTLIISLASGTVVRKAVEPVANPPKTVISNEPENAEVQETLVPTEQKSLPEILNAIANELESGNSNDTTKKQIRDRISTIKLANNKYSNNSAENSKIDVCGKIQELLEMGSSKEDLSNLFVELERYKVKFCKLSQKENNLEIINKDQFSSTKGDPEDIGLRPAKKDDKWGYIDKSDKIIIDFKYNDAYVFYGGYAFVKLNDKWGVIDKDGTIKIQPQDYWIPKFGFKDKKATVTIITTKEEKCINIKNEKVDCN